MKSFKINLKLLWACCWYYTGLLNIFQRARDHLCSTDSTIILLYHRIIPRANSSAIFSLPGIVVFQDTFEKQVRFLSEHYHIIPLSEYIKAKKSRNALPHKTIVITFDDGWGDNYFYAFPILKKYQVPATIFLTAGFIGTEKLFWPEKIIFLTRKMIAANSMNEFFETFHIQELHNLFLNLFEHATDPKSWYLFIERMKEIDEQKIELLITELETFLKKPSIPRGNHCLKWNQAEDMARFHCTFGSHGINHKILTTLDNKYIQEEALESKRIIEKNLNSEVIYFAYPNGNYNETVVGILRSSGYQAAFTTEKGINKINSDLYALKRINIHEGMLSDSRANFSKELFSAYLGGIL